jgi:tRNA threonylcarbamoyladenosine biosynthesis protein TsaB
MVLLAIDTSGREGSLSLARVQPKQPQTEILEEVLIAGGTFSAQLVPQARALLAKHRLGKEDIAGFAVVSGPGSFTGLRVGLAAIKALSEVLQKPIAAISLLEVIARSAEKTGRVLAVLDAGRSEIYVGEYELGPPVRMINERLVTREEFLADAIHLPVITPDRSLVEALRSAGLNCELVNRPTSRDIAHLGQERILAGETVSPQNLEANYIRRSDAEIFSKPKL